MAYISCGLRGIFHAEIHTLTVDYTRNLHCSLSSADLQFHMPYISMRLFCTWLPDAVSEWNPCQEGTYSFLGGIHTETASCRPNGLALLYAAKPCANPWHMKLQICGVNVVSVCRAQYWEVKQFAGATDWLQRASLSGGLDISSHYTVNWLQ